MSVCVCVRACVGGGREKGHIELRTDGANMSAEVLSVSLSLSLSYPSSPLSCHLTPCMAHTHTHTSIHCTACHVHAFLS
jgi:hypothetical protein